METKNKFGRNNILILLVVLLLLVSALQSVFLIKLYRATEFDNAEVNFKSSIDKSFEKQGDFFNKFDLYKQWDPFEEFQSMREQMERMFDDSNNMFKLSPFFNDESKSTMVPQTDLEDKGDHYLVTMNIPGADKAEIKVDLEGEMLTISAQTKTNHADKNKNSFLRMERSLGSFQRSMILPGPVDASGIKTEYEDGVLIIILPKQNG